MKWLVLVTAGLVSTHAWGDEDPYLWLEGIQDEKAMAWVKQQNERSLGKLTEDPRFEVLEREALEILTSESRIPLGNIHGKHVFNFWQDADHVRGILRRTTIDSYVGENTQWETLLDMDALAKEEDENWVYQGYQCLAPQYQRCYIRMSRGGTDASVYREYLVSNKEFVADGFLLPEAKSSVQWVDENHWLVGSDWGKGSLTDSGYARTVKLWNRDQPPCQSKNDFLRRAF